MNQEESSYYWQIPKEPRFQFSVNRFRSFSGHINIKKILLRLAQNTANHFHFSGDFPPRAQRLEAQGLAVLCHASGLSNTLAPANQLLC